MSSDTGSVKNARRARAVALRMTVYPALAVGLVVTLHCVRPLPEWYFLLRWSFADAQADRDHAFDQLLQQTPSPARRRVYWRDRGVRLLDEKKDELLEERFAGPQAAYVAPVLLTRMQAAPPDERKRLWKLLKFLGDQTPLGLPGRLPEMLKTPALRWLALTQEPDGHWDCAKQGGDGRFDTAVTSWALLVYCAYGNSYRFGRWKEEVKAATDWLMRQQSGNGRIGPDDLQAALAAAALAEAYGMGDKRIRVQAQAAIRYGISRQQGDGGWTYAGAPPPGGAYDSDEILTAYWVLALKSGYVAGLTVPQIAKQQANAYFRAVVRTRLASAASDKWQTDPDTVLRAAMALNSLQVTGAGRDDPDVRCAAEIAARRMPQAEDVDLQRYYFQALGFFQLGSRSEPWMIFNPRIKELFFANAVWNTLPPREPYPGMKRTLDQASGPMARRLGDVGRVAIISMYLTVYYCYSTDLWGKKFHR